MQQIELFRTAQPRFEAHYMVETMVQTLQQMEAAFLERLPVGMRLRGIPAQERLQGISPEELLKAMGAQDKKRLRKILEEEISADAG
jgi:hypothetical protein